jgi:signal transduction histidine kinase
VQTEKLASLGQLTAGIAHEIKNPLNFVNNFAAPSVELVDELDDVLKPAALDNKTREGTEELTQILKGNLEKVVQHGQRADSIVKNMRLHSRRVRGSAARTISTPSSRTASILRTTAPGQRSRSSTSGWSDLLILPPGWSICFLRRSRACFST